MKIEPLKCPQCGGTLNIPEDRDYYICDFCKTKVRVDRREEGPTRLTRFDVLLAKVVTHTKFLAATERLKIVDAELYQAGSIVANEKYCVEEATRQRDALEDEGRAAAREKVQQFAGLTVAAVIAWLVTLASLGSSIALLFFVVAAVLSGGAWYTWANRQAGMRQVAARVQAAEEGRQAAAARLKAAEAEMQDLALEQELCQRIRLNFRMRGDDDDER